MSHLKGKLKTAIEQGDYAAVKKLLAASNSSAISKESDVYMLLSKAVNSKYPLITKFLLGKFNKVNFPLELGDPLLITAIGNKDVETIKVLIDKGADLNFSYEKKKSKKSKDNSEDYYFPGPTTPLYEAMKAKSIKIVKYLLAKGADLNFLDQKTRSPLDFAIGEHFPEYAKLLVEMGATAMSTDGDGQPLHVAARWCPEILGPLIDRGADVNCRDAYDETPLHIACSEGNLEAVKLLIGNGADLEAKSSRWNESILLSGAHNPEIVKYLLKLGVAVNVKNNSGETPLQKAAYYNRPKSVELLLKHGGKLESKEKLLIVASRSSPEILKLLLKGNRHWRFDDYYSSISEAYSVSTLNNVVLLLEQGMHPDAKVKYNKSIDTPLNHAFKKGYFGIAASLLEAGADVDKLVEGQNFEALTPLYEYLYVSNINKKYSNVVSLCLDHGADVNLLPDDCRTIQYSIRRFVGYTFIKYIAKMVDQKLRVDNRILTCITSTEELKNQYKACEEEIEMLKTAEFDGTTFTFYDVLTKNVNQLALCARNEKVGNTLKERKKYEEKFPIYGSTITERLKMGMNRKQLLNKTNQRNRVLFPRLPLNCINQILDHLDNRDLKVLIYICKFAGK